MDEWNKKFNSLIYGNICAIHLKEKRHKEAMKAINKAIEYDDCYAKGFYRRGMLNKDLENWEDCERDFKRAQA